MSDGASVLDKLFPAAPPHTVTKRVRTAGNGFEARPQDISRSGKGKREDITTKWAAIYTLELRGLRLNEIADAVNMTPQGVSRVVTDERYVKYRESRLDAMDADFIAMKPLAYAALRSGLNSADENTALRASEQWFKGANFGGFSKHERPQTGLTAEDVARQLLNNLQVNVQVNVNKDEPSGRD